MGDMDSDDQAAMHSPQKKTVKKVGQTCPLCGKLLVQRMNGKTEHLFIGCSDFPGCRFSQ